MFKQLTLVCFVLLAAVSVQAQMETPQPSPAAMKKQTVGLTEVTLEYSRPAMRGREIFGDLVPYDQVWRTGANANTKFTVSDDIMVNGKELKAGTYALYTKPGKKSWDVIFYSDASNWGTPRQWDDSKVALTTNVPTRKMGMEEESFDINIATLNNDGAHLVIEWASTQVRVPFTVPTSQKAMKSIEAAMAGPTANDMYSAATYYHDAGLDLKQAHKWITQATEGRPEAFWYHRRKSLIEADLGMKNQAISSARKSLDLAQKAGNMDYVKMNKDSLKEWGAM